MNFFELPDYPIIDAHMHPYLAGHRNFPFDVPKSYDEFFDEQKRAGILLSCGSFNIRCDGSDFSVIRECNSKVLDLHFSRPQQFLPGVNVHPKFPDESCSEVEKFYNLGFRVIGEIAAYFMNYKNYFCPGLLPVFDLAQDKGMVVNIHPSSIEDIEQILKNFPNLKLIAAHPGLLSIAENFSLAQKYPNLYFDLSGTGLAKWGMLRKGIDLIGPRRFIFGTDFPVTNPGMYVAAVFFEHLSDQERKMIFHDNFVDITGYKVAGV